ncbi:glycosyltransferase [Streptomyces sp. NPDC095613]|uniref:glycosyltransferase n=1 Tax=Streptomyces sp. NPDC095613 TaxID=3155540 RepID=UPI003330C289
MRVLCTATGSPSHGRALLPLARALAAAGHEVTVASTAAVAPVFADDDVTVVSCLPPLVPSGGADGRDPARTTASAGPRDADRAVRVPGDPGTGVGGDEDAGDGDADGLGPDMRKLVARLSGSHALEGHRALRPLARDMAPDVIVRDGMDLGACLLAEQLGVPHLPIPSGFVNTVDPALLLPGLNRLRESLGLPVREDPASLHPHGRFDYLPRDHSFARFPATVLAYRQTTAVDRTAGLPEWVARLPTDRPLVFAAMGTALPMFRGLLSEGASLPHGVSDPSEVLRAIVAGLSLLECVAVVATSGIACDGVEPGPNVHLTDSLAQPLLLECADLFVTHGGYNSVREAVRTGTPMVVAPHFGDQPLNARRVRELGLGRHLTDLEPRALAEVCADLLADREVAARCRRARLATLALPDIGRSPADLAELCARAAVRSPRTSSSTGKVRPSRSARRAAADVTAVPRGGTSRR